MECSLSLRTERWRVFTPLFTQDFILSQSKENLFATLLSPLVCLAACMLADGEQNLEVFPASESPASALQVARLMLTPGQSLVESRGASLHAMVPGTDVVLFRSERQNVGWEPFTGGLLRARGREITTLGAHDNYCQIVRAERGAALARLAAALAARDAHETNLVDACEEAHARGVDPSLLVFTYERISGAGCKIGAEAAAARAFENRGETELRLANCGAVVMLLESVDVRSDMTFTDLDRLIANVAPKQYQALRNRAIVVLPKNYVYVEEAGGLPNNALKLFARGARIVSESVIYQLEAVSEPEWKLTSTRCGRCDADVNGRRVDGVASMASRRWRRGDGVASTASRRRRRGDGVAAMWRRGDGVAAMASRRWRRWRRSRESTRVVFTVRVPRRTPRSSKT